MFSSRLLLAFFFYLEVPSVNAKCDVPEYDLRVLYDFDGHTRHLTNVVESRSRFVEWKNKYNKSYPLDDAEEELKRQIIWNAHDGYINCHNSQSSVSYTLDHNKFSDLTNVEYRELNNLIVKSSAEYNLILGNYRKKYVDDNTSTEMRNLIELTQNFDLPLHKNWIDDGAVTPVQDQKSCGNCWAFSAVGAIEGAMSVKYEQLTPLSEQMLVDCSIGEGCKGDLMQKESLFKFEESHDGLCTKDDYPYTARESECSENCPKLFNSIVSAYVDLTEGNERELQIALNMQPVSVALQADQLSFQLYKEGVFDDVECGKNGIINHGALVVGYGQMEDGGGYWLVKNSWGEDWGDDGYIRLKKDASLDYGTCSISRVMTFPILV